MKEPNKFAQYIGDGVYASYDGWNIVLTTGNHEPALADNIIALEPEVIESLNRYTVWLKARLEADNATTQEK